MKLSFMKYCLILGLTLFAYIPLSLAQDSSDQHDAVKAALNNYLNGSSYSRPDQIKSAFYAESDMFLHHPEKPIYRMTSETYAALFEKRERGKFNGRYGKILDIDISGDIATAKAEILIPKGNARYIDIFILKKLDGDWKILSKAAGHGDSDRSGDRILLIATDRPAPLSELIKAFKQAYKAGYTAEIVSPQGGPFIFKAADMRDSEHRTYLYDADFMYALKHTRSPDEIDPKDFASAKFIRKADARRGKTKAEPLNTLFAAICKGKKQCEK
ncbi:MAG: nuclear transport factor 2 family protein [Hellea sp.]